MSNEIKDQKGGEGSGNFGHEGRPGERGGSAPSDAGMKGASVGDVRRGVGGTDNMHKLDDAGLLHAKDRMTHDEFREKMKAGVGRW